MLQLCFLCCFLLDADEIHYVALSLEKANSALRILQAGDFMNSMLHPDRDITGLSVEQQYQVTALRMLLDSLGARMARWEGRSVFDQNRNALRCGKLVDVTDYREDRGLDGLPCVECRCRFEVGGVLIRLGFSDTDSAKDIEILSVHVVPDPEEPAPEFFPEHGYYRHRNHFYSTLFSTEVAGPPHPNEPAPVVLTEENGGNTTMPPEYLEPLKLDPEWSRPRQLAECFLYEVRVSQERAPETGVTDGLSGRWTDDVNHLASLFRKFSHEMARRGGRNLVDGSGSAVRCGRFTHVAGYRDFTHFDGTKMIEADCRMEMAGVRVRLAFDETEARVTAVHVVRDSSQPIPEFFPKTGYYEGIDPAPLPGRSSRINASASRGAFALLLRREDGAPDRAHLWRSGEKRRAWEDPETKIRWEPFEPSVSYDVRRNPWANGFPYSEAAAFSGDGRFHWGRLPAGEYRVAAATVPPELTYGYGNEGEIDFSVFLGSPVTLDGTPGRAESVSVSFPETETKTLAIRDAETGEAVSGDFSLKIHCEGFPEQIRFFAYRPSRDGVFSLRNLTPGSYTLEIRRLQGSLVEPVRRAYRFEFDAREDAWNVRLPRPWEGTTP